MKRTTALLLALLLILLCGCGKKEATETVYAMDTVMELTVWGPGAEKQVQAAAERIQELEETLSVTRSDSEVARLNAGETVVLSEDAAALLEQSLILRDETDGAMDPTIYPLVKLWGFTTREYRVPTEAEIAEMLAQVRAGTLEIEDGTAAAHGLELDFGAVAKGYAGAVLARELKEAGVKSALLTLGGNVQTVGLKPDGSRWRIGVRDPWGAEGIYLGVLTVGETAVVTSGGYQRYFEEDGTRYCHILDPSTGYPASSGLASVTIVAEDSLLADGLSTALYVMGLEKASDFWRNRGGFEAVLVTDDGTIFVTAGLRDCFACREFQVIER